MLRSSFLIVYRSFLSRDRLPPACSSRDCCISLGHCGALTQAVAVPPRLGPRSFHALRALLASHPLWLHVASLVVGPW